MVSETMRTTAPRQWRAGWCHPHGRAGFPHQKYATRGGLANSNPRRMNPVLADTASDAPSLTTSSSERSINVTRRTALTAEDMRASVHAILFHIADQRHRRDPLFVRSFQSVYNVNGELRQHKVRDPALDTLLTPAFLHGKGMLFGYLFCNIKRAMQLLIAVKRAVRPPELWYYFAPTTLFLDYGNETSPFPSCYLSLAGFVEALQPSQPAAMRRFCPAVADGRPFSERLTVACFVQTLRALFTASSLAPAVMERCEAFLASLVWRDAR